MGKVHGSLARAGKVKSQTPKVCMRSFRCDLPQSINFVFDQFSPRVSDVKPHYLGKARTLIRVLVCGIGRTSREEEDTQGPGEEENNIHPAVRECHDDGWEEEGTLWRTPECALCGRLLMRMLCR